MKPCRYDISQNPYDYAVEVMNRFERLDLVDTVLEKPWEEVHNILQKTVNKTIWKKKKKKEMKEGLSCLRRLY